MSTSANVIEYSIETLDGKHVGNYRQNLLCTSHYEDLLKYQPLDQHLITSYGYDEDDEEWEDKSENLEIFINRLVERKIIKI